MVRTILFFYLFSFAFNGFSQDERFIRKFFSKVQPKKSDNERFIKKLVFKDKIYNYDLNGDGLTESMQKSLEDGILHLKIMDGFGRVLHKFKFGTSGADTDIYKIQVRSLTPKKGILLFYVYNGYIEGREFYGTTNLYYAIFPRDDIRKMVFDKGPAIWMEKRGVVSYLQRIHQITLEDINNDNIKELIISKSGTPINRVYKFNGNRLKKFH